MKQKFITKEQLQQHAPSVFTEQKHKSITDRYVLISTPEVLKAFSKLGWKPIFATELNVRKKSNRGYQKHFVRLRHVSCDPSLDLIPEILLSNSYNGKSSYSFSVYMLRKVCSNGLYMADATLQNCKIPHRGNVTMGELTAAITRVINHIPNIIKTIKVLQDTEISLSDAQSLGSLLYKTKYSNVDVPLSKEYLNGLISPLRKEDEKRTIWNVYNIVQEKLMEQSYIQHNNRQSRPLSNFDRMVRLNQQLFDVTVEFTKSLQH